jgi:hypothetical protein
MQMFSNDDYNYFQRIPMTEEEQKAGATFNPLQKVFIQNYISQLAGSLLSVGANLETPAKAEIERGYLRGQIDALKSLIDIDPNEED